jgi:WD40 repeat protein
VATSKNKEIHVPHRGHITAIQFDLEGPYLYSGSTEGDLLVWQADIDRSASINKHLGNGTAVAVT